jgi:hypothetical protein
MSTRAIYTFKDSDASFHVFKHHDGYPSGAFDAIKATIESGKCWGAHRFEADEFAAGFIATNKPDHGGVRLAKSRRFYADVAYGYTITHKNGSIHITATEIEGWDAWKETKIFAGTLAEFEAFAMADA